MLAVPDVWEGTKGLLVASRGPAQTTFGGASIDSREVRPGDLFFALRGERRDGHEFVAQALSAGAAGVVVERPIEAPDNAALFQVSDSLKALQRLAAHWRGRHEVRVVGVTGSVGKTTCKELIAGVLAKRYRVLKSEANLNTEIGIPLTLLRLSPEHEHAVLEFGMYARGDLALLTEIAAPHIGVVTNIGPVHLERLGTMGAIIAAKAELVEALPADGIGVLNGDDARATALAARTHARAVLYGQSRQCQMQASDVVSRGLDGFSFRLTHGEASVEVSCPLSGKHHVYAALAAAAVALNEGMSLSEIAEALAVARPELRVRVLSGPNGSTILDDSYNASPASMLAALELLEELPGRHIALLGEMRELGVAEEDSHRSVGERAVNACDLLLVIGERARPILEAAQDGGLKDARFLESKEVAIDLLGTELGPGDHLLVKASRALALEAVVDALTAR